MAQRLGDSISCKNIRIWEHINKSKREQIMMMEIKE
jgi:hypothetical protein